MKILTFIFFIGSLPLLSGCGEDGDNLLLRDVKDVTNVEYHLKSAEMVADFHQPENGTERIVKNIRFKDGISKDKIRRVIDNTNYRLIVNEAAAEIKISSEGIMETEKKYQDITAGCAVNAFSRVTGKIETLTLEMSWEMDATIDGPNCTPQNRANFVKFQDDAIRSVNLLSAKDLISVGDQPRESLSHVHLSVRLFADGY